MKKKLLTLLLVLVMVCGCLAGCGGKDGDEGQGGSGGKGGVTELTLWCSYDEASTTVLEGLVEKFNEEYKDQYHMSVENTGTVTTYRTKLLSLKKSDYPSVFFGVSNAMAEYADASYVVPIQQYVDEDSDKWTEDWYDNVKAAYSDQDGNLVGGVMGLSTKGYMVNVTALEAAGYTVADITSFEKIAEISQAAVDKGVVKYGYCIGDGNDIYDMLIYQGVDIFDGGNGYTGDITKCMYTEGDTKASLKKLIGLQADLFKSGAAYKNTGGTSACMSLWVNEQALFWTCTNSFVYEFSDLDLNFEWAFVPFTGVDENAKYKGCALTEGTGMFIANSEDEAQMQGGYEFIKFMSRTDMQVEWCTYRGYVPYTKEAAASEEWVTYQNEFYPSAGLLMDMMQNTPSDLRFPNSELMAQVLSSNANIKSIIMTEPDSNIDELIQNAADSINESIEIQNLRGN
ncbi:MAG: extracellular solute-binding protein [Tyzzerella sp.]|nr:extracellular solute-binding protein [Tyzzerella sp.]